MVRVGGRRLVLAGHGDGDRYFRNLGGGREDGFARVCRGLLRDDDVALDIGANIGVTAAILSEVVEKGRVHAVEAGPVTFRLLEENLAANGLSNVTPHHAAITDRSGTLRFHEDSAFGHVATGADGQEVPALTIDDLVRSLGLERLDFIKLDVEGSEWAALRGAAQTIASLQPIIYVEFNSWCLAAYGRVNPVEFAEWLFGNFVYVFADPSTKRKRIPPHAALSMAHDNMVRKGGVENLLLANDGRRVETWSKDAAHRGTSCRGLSQSLRALFGRFRAWRG